MFDFAWSEIGVIAVVALIFIGPKDMPVAIKTVTGAIKKARRMASEFQSHVDEMVRDADLHEVREHLGDLRTFNLGRTLEKFIDDDGSIRRSFDDPLASTSLASGTTAPDGTGPLGTGPLDQAFVDVAERPVLGEPAEAVSDAVAGPAQTGPATHPDAPAFIPPGFALLPQPGAPAAEPPSFIPPAFARPVPPMQPRL